MKLAQALNLLDIGDIALFNDAGTATRRVTPKEHATALFSYLDLAGYLSPELLEKAVIYLSAAKPFSCSNEKVIAHLKDVYHRAHRDESFNLEWFFDHFCNTPDFQVDDIIDLIVFLQQTAFDRQFGVERDKLQAKPWLEHYSDLFKSLTTSLGIVTPLPPAHEAYCGTGIMGAASVRVNTRIQYFNSLHQNCGEVWALSGNRELSQGLDEEQIMIEVAQAVNKPVHFVEKGTGVAKRTFLDGITETMMVNYLIKKMCTGKNVSVVNSSVEEGHWRATTAQSAKDVAQILIKKIQDGDISEGREGTYHFMIIAEQPYAGRMAKQVQRAFNTELVSKNLASSIKVIVEGAGAGISEAELNNIGVLTRMNSELGSLMAERFNDARLRLQQSPNSSVLLRDPKILMFMDRDAKYRELKLQQEQSVSIDAAPKQ